MLKAIMDLNKNVVCSVNCYRTNLLFVRGLKSRNTKRELFNVYKETLISALNIEPERTIRDLKKIKVLPAASEKDILGMCQLLDKFNVQGITVSRIGKLMSQSIYDVEKKILLLNEFGSTKITVSTLVHFNAYLRKSEKVFKRNTNIPNNQCLMNNLNSCIGGALTHITKDGNPKNNQRSVRKQYNEFFLQYIAYLLNLNETEVAEIREKNLNSYSIRHNSLKLTQQMIDLLKNNFQFDNKLILDNFWLVSHHPNHALATLEFLRTVDGLDINSAVQRIPKVLQNNAIDLQKILDCLKKSGITAEMIEKCPYIFYVSYTALRDRMNHLLKLPMCYVFRKHPRFLYLVSDYNIVIPRIKYLEKEKINYTTIHALITHRNHYEMLRNKKKLRMKNLRSFFISEFKEKADDLLNKCMKHHFCRYVPLAQQYDTLIYLKKKYSSNTIHEHIYAILYSRSNLIVAEEKLLRDPNYRDMKADHLLVMCVYLLERQIGFTGEAVLDSVDIDKLEIGAC